MGDSTLMTISMRLAQISAGFVAIAAVTSCTTPESLEERAAAYWQARKERDAATSYRYEHPEQRGTESQYLLDMSGGPLTIRDAKVEAVEIDGDEASVTMRLEYGHPMVPRNVTAPIVDRWTRVDGEWYHTTGPTTLVTGDGNVGIRLPTASKNEEEGR